MKAKILLLVIMAFSFYSCNMITETMKFTSPNGAIEVTFKTDEIGRAYFTVLLDNDIVISDSPLGILLNDEQYDFTQGLKLLKIDRKNIDEEYTMTTGKQLQRRNHCNEATCILQNSSGKTLSIVFRVFNDGIAFRYQLNNDVETSILRELSAYHFNTISNIWSIPFSADDERFFTKQESPQELANQNLSFPVLVEIQSNKWALVTESDVSNYSLSTGQFVLNRLDYTFPTSWEAVNVVGQNFISPWRVIIMGNDLGTIVESCIIDHLAPASRVDDISWIKPGVTCFPWWGDVFANNNPETIKKYIDLSAEMNWPFVEFDLALVGTDNGGHPTTEWKTTDWIKDVVDYGLGKGVKCYGWDALTELNTSEKREEIFLRYKELGLAGIKVDYISSYSQRTRKLVKDVLVDAARHELLVSFHGAQSPRGFARTYPHAVTFEAVLGAEHYLPINGKKTIPASHNCTLPFTRNVLGSMDYTPVAFSAEQRMTSMAHELATSVVFESGWQGICDKPEVLLNSVAKDFLSQLQSIWDETIFLAGYPGEYACLARRNGNTWFIAGINSGDSRTVSVNLPFDYSGKVNVYNDLSYDLNSLCIVEHNVSKDKPLKITMQKNGGFAIIVTAQK